MSRRLPKNVMSLERVSIGHLRQYIIGKGLYLHFSGNYKKGKIESLLLAGDLILQFEFPRLKNSVIFVCLCIDSLK